MTFTIDGPRLEAWLREQHASLIQSAREHHEADGANDPTALRMDGGVASMEVILGQLRHFTVGAKTRTPLRDIQAAAETKVRRRDPSTSFEAAVAQTPKKSYRLYVAIQRLLANKGPMTDDELLAVMERVHFDHTPSGVRTRRKELVEAGWVKDSGAKRLSNAGKPSIVWEILPEEP